MPQKRFERNGPMGEQLDHPGAHLYRQVSRCRSGSESAGNSSSLNHEDSRGRTGSINL